MPSSSSASDSGANVIHKLDYPSDPGARKPLLSAHDHHDASSESGRLSHDNSYAGSFFEQVAEGIQERDLRKMKRELRRYVAFGWAIVNCLCAGSITAYSLYGHLFQSRLYYTQFHVNLVSITAELAMYLPVPIFGFLCDRYGPGPPSLLSGTFFGLGYLLAAFTYKSGPPKDRGGEGWPFGVMILGFAGVGMGTSCMYLSAVTTCAKNFGRGRFKGVALAVPIAAFGLSGMWQSQVGERLLFERRPDGSRGDVDVFRYFLFLGCLLLGVGVVGSVLLRVIDEEELIDEAVEELERSGLLEESEFFRRTNTQRNYGTTSDRNLEDEDEEFARNDAESLKQQQLDERRKKTWLLNEETRRFLTDRTMWWLAAGFFLVTGPGEAFINNLGTIIGTLYPPTTSISDIPTTAGTHVSIVAITSTLARLITGTLTDILAPIAPRHQHRRPPNSMASSLASLPSLSDNKRFTLSRLTFLLAFSLLLSLGQVLLASGLIQHHAERFWAVSALIGAGYGAVFSLIPIIVSVVWGVENFGTNWGIVATVPAAGATVWGVVYSAVYVRGAENGTEGHQVVGELLRRAVGVASGVTGMSGPGVMAVANSTVGVLKEDVLCYGTQCYAPTFWAMAVSVWLACGLWLWAWRGRGGWVERGIAV